MLKYYLTAITAVIETFFFNGILYGYGSFSYVLVMQGYFNQSCNETILSSTQNYNTNKELCSSQQFDLSLLYTLTLAVTAVFCPLLGWMLDQYGNWVVRTITSVLYIINCIIVAFTTQRKSWILYPTMILLNLLTPTVAISNATTGNLLPKLKGTIVNMVLGAGIANAAESVFIQMAYEDGISFMAIFVFLAASAVLVLLRTFYLMPRMHVPDVIPVDYDYGIAECTSKPIDEDNDSQALVPSSRTQVKSLQSCLCSCFFMLGTLSFAVQTLRLQFIAGTMDPWLKSFKKDDNLLELSSMISNLTMMPFVAFAAAPINGICIDLLTNHYTNKNRLSKVNVGLRVISWAMFVENTTIVLLSITALIPSLKLQYFTYFMNSVAATLMQGSFAYAFLVYFPIEHFGILIGIGIFASAATGMLEIPLYYLVQHYYHGDFLVINLVFLVLSFAMYVFPAATYYLSR